MWKLFEIIAHTHQNTFSLLSHLWKTALQRDEMKEEEEGIETEASALAVEQPT